MATTSPHIRTIRRPVATPAMMERLSLFVSAGLTTVIIAGGVVLSYNALEELATTSGAVDAQLAWLWPIMLDIMAVTGAANIFNAELRQKTDRYAWTILVAFTVLSVTFNAVHAGLDWLLALSPAAPVMLEISVGIIPPIAIALSIHLVMRLVSSVTARAGLSQTIDQLRDTAEELRADIAALEKQRSEAQTAISALQADIAKLERQREKAVNALHTVAAGHPKNGQVSDTVAPQTDTRAAAAARRRAKLATLLGDKTDISADTVKEWATRFNVSERTIQRDIKTLQEEG